MQKRVRGRKREEDREEGVGWDGGGRSGYLDTLEEQVGELVKGGLEGKVDPGSAFCVLLDGCGLRKGDRDDVHFLGPLVATLLDGQDGDFGVLLVEEVLNNVRFLDARVEDDVLLLPGLEGGGRLGGGGGGGVLLDRGSGGGGGSLLVRRL